MAVVDDLGHAGMDTPPPSEDFGRQPPQDAAAEQSVLGGMLLSKDAIADVLERLRPGDFYRPAHQNVYDAILDLYGRGEPADAVTVAAELDRRGLLRRIGGAPYLHTLISTVPTAANAGFYAGIVAEKALLRRLVEAGTRVVQYGYAGAEGADVAEIVDRAQAEIYDVTEGRTTEDFVALEDLLQPTMDEIDAIASQGGIARGVPTGFVELDEVTNGLHPGSDDRHRGQAWYGQGARSWIRLCRRRQVGPRWVTSRSAIWLLGRRREADARRGSDRGHVRAALLRGRVLRWHGHRRRRRAPVADGSRRARHHRLAARCGRHQRRRRVSALGDGRRRWPASLGNRSGAPRRQRSRSVR